jgi:very-short-patch-repair endonuclease
MDTETSSTPDFDELLNDKVQKWRGKLLDIGNRNPLVSCSFNPSRGVIEILEPAAEAVWRRLAADADAGTAPMRFPWRRELVPPPPPNEEVGTTHRKRLSFTESPTFFEVSEADIASVKQENEEQRDPKPVTPASLKNDDWNPSLEECRCSTKFRSADDLLADLTDRAIDRRLRTMDAHSRLAMSEQGVHSLFIAFGFLKWYEEPESADARFSPLILVPVTLSRKTTSASWEITEAEDDAIDNLCLRERLRQDFSLELPPLPDINELEEPGARITFLQKVRAAISDNARWDVEDRVALGVFAFPKVAMWKDLGDHAKFVKQHPLCRSIGGDTSVSPQSSFGPTQDIILGESLDDTVAPGDIKAILDCDSSQLEAIVAARRGISLVLDGPPGTGKSQTIANIIADALSEGRTVLFVSEKVSALGVVKRRLDERGLGDFCLECHSSKANRKAVLFELESCLELQTEVYSDKQPKLNEVKEKRDLLNEYVRSVHRPRQPLGLSPYELYGNVGRLTRLGFAGRSRCDLPDPAGVDRAIFDTWLELLARATDCTSAIHLHDQHPWRNCKLLSQSLSLSDDLQHHLQVLAASFHTVDQSISPLVSEGLLGRAPTPANLNEIVKLLSGSLDAPNIPEIWFRSPENIAGLILRQLNAEEVVLRLRGRLFQYVEAIEINFPDEAVRTLTDQEFPWCSRLHSDLQDSLRGQYLTIKDVTSRLNSLDMCLTNVEMCVATLIEQLRLPIKSDLPIAAIPKLIELAESVVECGTMRSLWLNPEKWYPLRQLVVFAKSALNEANRYRDSLRGRIPSDNINALSRIIQNENHLQEAWRIVEEICPDGTERELEKLVTTCDLAQRGITEAETTIKSLWILLELKSCESLSVGTIEKLSEPIRKLAESHFIHGTWSDAAVRTTLRDACNAVVDDLEEANSLRDDLSIRMSHRAFRSSARGIAESASSYSTFTSRLFGKFNAFRKIASELYKERAPTTAELLSDMDKLRRYHRRIEDVQSAAESVRPFLPTDHAILDVAAWNHIRDAIDLNEQFFDVAGKQVSISDTVTTLPRGALSSIAKTLSDSMDRYRTAIAGHRHVSIFIDKPIAFLPTHLALQRDAAFSCHKAITAAKGIYNDNPSNIMQLFLDVATAKLREDCLSQVNRAFTDNESSMPEASTALEFETWDRLFDGINAAERVSRLVRNTKVLEDVLCKDGGFNRLALSDAIAMARGALDSLNVAIQHSDNCLDLNSPNAPRVETNRRSLVALKAVTTAANSEFDAYLQLLCRIAIVLRDDTDTSVRRLTDDLTVVDRLRSALSEGQDSAAQLSAMGIENVRTEDLPNAKWLLKFAESGNNSPLTEAVASRPGQRERIRKLLSQVKAAVSGEFRSSWEFLKTLFDLNSDISTGFTVVKSEMSFLALKMNELRLEAGSLQEWIKFSRWKRDMRDAGFLPVIDELLAGRYAPEEVIDVISVRFYRKLFDHLASTDRTLAEFDVEEHERVREQFQRLDQWEVRAAATRIREYQLGRDDRPRSGFSAAASSELGILQREIAKKRKHMPLRRLFSEIPSVLQRLKPCIMMSPLSVSTFLESDQIRFDLVIFDEASQVFPWDAIGAIYRAKQAIVAGDEKQLPPTNFFSRADTETDEEDDIGDFESILSLCKSINMPSKRLRWHYRSKREPLIAFSNRHFYDGDLVTFPSIRDAAGDAVRLELVSTGRWVDRKNIPEAEKVADLIIHHLRTRPEVSLGVIAFNQSQQRAIEDLIYDRRRLDPQIDAVFGSTFTEPLFVKNLENVQGDERDVIILSMAYGFNESGKFLKNFGPLSKAGGERRLNVAVTRAREEIVFVSSVRAADMDLTGSNSEGAHLLKAYLEYAEKGVDTLGRLSASFNAEAESPFEEEVAAALIRHGLEPVPQVGCGGFRIDMALKHPKRPGEFCLGIECDGATYHSSQTARDRDRIRQGILESLGWNIVRVWSTDWVRDTNRQLQRILAAYESAIRQSGPLISPKEAIEEDDADLNPTIVETGVSPSLSLSFSSINDVPPGQILKTAKSVLKHAGATEFEDLIKLTARELGFLRLGPRIRNRLEQELTRCLDNGELTKVGDRISAV